MPISAALARKLTEIDPPLREAMLLLVEEMEKQREQLAQQVTRAEFYELKEVVADLVVTVKDLAEAQKRTEARLERLEVAVAELAEAQKRTEERVNQLAEAQKRTEEELRKLAVEHRVTRERLEGISNTVGYTLEDRAYKSLPTILVQKGIRVEGRLLRRYVQVGKKERQVNIYGHGYRNGQRVLILGEAKVRPSRREVDRFLRLVRQLEGQEGLPAVTLFVAYDFLPSVEAYIRERGILPVWSYELE